MSTNDLTTNTDEVNVKSMDNLAKKSRSENLLARNRAFAQSDSFSEPDTTVSVAIIK